MAIEDHTARTPVLGCHPIASASNDDVSPRHRNKALAKRRTYVTKLVGISMASNAIRHLLDDDDARYSEGPRHECPECGKGPLTSAQTIGLFTALFHLRQYVALLKPESSG